MPLDSKSLLRLLHELQRQIAESPQHCASQRAAWTGADRSTFLHATINAERHARALALTTQRIREHVTPADGLGDPPLSLSELTMRAVRLVVLAELATLGEVIAERPAMPSCRPSCVGFPNIEDLMTFVRAQLAHITDEWGRYQRLSAVERDRYRSALRRAHAALHALGTRPEFARFLETGCILADWPALQAVCTRMRDVAISIDVEPDAPVVIVVRPLDAHANQRAS
jgi:hypothetical protein